MIAILAALKVRLDICKIPESIDFNLHAHVCCLHTCSCDNIAVSDFLNFDISGRKSKCKIREGYIIAANIHDAVFGGV